MQKFLDLFGIIIVTIWDLNYNPCYHILKGNLPARKGRFSNRQLIFDPIVFISPFVVRIECLFQKLWTKGLGWYEEFPDELQQNWLQWCKEITLFSEFKIPR
ncbi:hypothetical protein NPIL_419451 [Nephila pilipes]|uniref:Uncharacterized protein n=1 Tax=Nephila pilipes TaxID=299642 RepID=A0A8X6QN31_NEPPI|nr:hypothetical protein NPIL_419451 [Nephila pilipes]